MIRQATVVDIPALNQLLQEILQVHHGVRPDIFRPAGQKFSSSELADLMSHPETPIFVYETDGKILGHMFCQIAKATSPVLEPIKTLFIEELCVAQEARGQKIGKQLYDFAVDLAKKEGCYNLTQQLYDFAVDFAKKEGCHNLTLDVWDANHGAKSFYERQGLEAQKTRMELRLDT